MTRVSMTVNGRAVDLSVPVERLLVDVLRADLGLTGTKSSCGLGVCGACTVLVDGRPASACLMLACLADGREILTIEGLATGDRLDPMQQAFVEAGALECGFCTPGMVLSARALLDGGAARTPDEVADFMAGNLCRCTGYADILRAIGLAAGRLASRGTRA